MQAGFGGWYGVSGRRATPCVAAFPNQREEPRIVLWPRGIGRCPAKGSRLSTDPTVSTPRIGSGSFPEVAADETLLAWFQFHRVSDDPETREVRSHPGGCCAADSLFRRQTDEAARRT